MTEILVTKRNGTTEPLDYDKIHKVLTWATEGLKNVTVSDIEMNSRLQIKNKTTTKEIHLILIQSASDLMSPRSENYQYVAGRLLNYYLRKELFNESKELPHLKHIIETNVKRGIYDKVLLEQYDDNDLDIINDIIKHERDFKFAYAGIRQLMDKYLLQDRITKEIFETPQYMYIVIAMTLFGNIEKKGQRYNHIRKFYNDISLFKISLPTPIMCGVRTPLRQYSSCTLIDIGDDINSIFTSDMAIGRYTAKRAGIGLNIGRIRGLGASIRNGEVTHTGLIPFLKKFEATTKCCTQNAVRGGNSSSYYPFWHQEVESLIVLKNNRGTEDNRVRHMDYGIQLHKLFYQRFIAKQNITLFSPHDVLDLYEAFFDPDTDMFEKLYIKYENSNVKKKSIPATELFSSIIRERFETGRIYIMNVDNVSRQGMFLDKVYMSNLCAEIVLPTSPITHIDDNDDQSGEIALCVLSAINLGEINKLSDIEGICENIIRALDYVIEHQEYPVNAARKMLKRRSIGVGITNLAYYLAKNKMIYGSKESLYLLDETMEYINYYMLKSSVQLAIEYGPCEYFNRTKYSQGLLTIDTYNKNLDTLVQRPLTLDWEALRQDIKTHGLRNSAFLAQMPCESSSAVSNSTNGIEPPRALLTAKKSKHGTLNTLVPEVGKLMQYYTLAWEMVDNDGYIKTVCIMQKWIDQAMSTNMYYNPDHPHRERREISYSEMINDILKYYYLGGKNLYYNNTQDGNNEVEDKSCAGGACSV